MTPPSPPMTAGQITRANSKRLSALLLQSNPKKTNWNAIRAVLHTYHPNKKDAPNLDGLLHQALSRSFLDPSGVSVGTLELLLQKTRKLSLPERLRYASTAVRCRNRKALRALIDDDVSVLFYCTNNSDEGEGEGEDENTTTTKISTSGGSTLLHMVCEEHGWNDEIAFVLDEILKHNDVGSGNHHRGLFQETVGSEIPLKLALQTGSDLEEILDHVRSEHPDYMERNLDRLSQIVAEYCYEMTLLSDLIDVYGVRLLDSFHPNDGSSPLAFACYYQNEDMIRLLLEEYCKMMNRAKCGERSQSHNKRKSRLRVRKRLLSPNNEGMSPLGHLLLNVGDPDAENAWRCINACVDFFSNYSSDNDNDNNNNKNKNNDDDEYEQEGDGISRLGQQRFPILQLFLMHTWDALIAKKNCIKILDRIVQRLGIDLCVVDDETGSTVLSIVIEKLSVNHPIKSKRKANSKALQILDRVVTIDPPAMLWNSTTINRPATTRDGMGRLPLHSACEHSLSWERGLRSIVNVNVPALESIDPITRLPPFAHCAVGPISDLDSIFELLRLNPGIMDSVLPAK